MSPNFTEIGVNGERTETSGSTGAIMLTKCFDLDQFLMMDNFKRVSLILNTIIYPIVAISGWLGYALLMRKLSNANKLKSRFGKHLIMLCAFDSALTLLVMLVQMPSYILNQSLQTYGSWSLALYVLSPIADMMKTCAGWQLIALSVERLWFVSRPLRSRSMVLISVWSMSGIIASVSFMAYIPLHFIEYSLFPCDDEGHLTFQVRRSGRLNSSTFSIIFNVIPSLILDCPAPFCIVSVVALFTAKHAGKTVVSRSRRTQAAKAITLDFTQATPEKYKRDSVSHGKRKRSKGASKKNSAAERSSCTPSQTSKTSKKNSGTLDGVKTITVRDMAAAGRRRPSLHLQIVLLVLSVKYMICHIPLMLKTFVELVYDVNEANKDWKEGIAHYTRMLYVDEASTGFIVLHCATNWLMFYSAPGSITTTATTEEGCSARSRSRHTPGGLSNAFRERTHTLESNNCSHIRAGSVDGQGSPTMMSRRNSFCSGQLPLTLDEIQTLRIAWHNGPWQDFGMVFLEQVLARNATLTDVVIGASSSPIGRSRKLQHMGGQISRFINDCLLIDERSTPRDVIDLRHRARIAGETHHYFGVALKADEWRLFKTCLQDHIMRGRRTSDDSRSDKNNDLFKASIGRLCNFMISELKYGQISKIGERIANGCALRSQNSLTLSEGCARRKRLLSPSDISPQSTTKCGGTRGSFDSISSGTGINASKTAPLLGPDNCPDGGSGSVTPNNGMRRSLTLSDAGRSRAGSDYSTLRDATPVFDEYDEERL